jgi:hypothetical protein
MVGSSCLIYEKLFGYFWLPPSKVCTFFYRKIFFFRAEANYILFGSQAGTWFSPVGRGVSKSRKTDVVLAQHYLDTEINLQTKEVGIPIDSGSIFSFPGFVLVSGREQLLL